MKVSLITASYNSAPDLVSCMESVVNQDYSNIEYIIVDGASSDETLSIIADYQNKFDFIKVISEGDGGIYDALNKGVELTTGDIIGFVHSDDVLADTTIISRIVAQFNNEAVDGVYGDLNYVDKDDINKIIRKWISQSFKKNLLKKGWMPAHPTLFLKKEVYEAHGNFDLGYKIAADYDFMLRILKDESLKFSYLPEVISKMRMGGASNRSLKNIIQKTKEDYRAVTSNKIGGVLSILRKNTSKIKQFF